ncbi:MAG: hypothetical protein KAT68_05065 [Bacteroidales bacterium]|nr:hypothetical protein [Bacteroidales bacterium]
MKKYLHISNILKLNQSNLNSMRRLSLLFVLLTSFVCYSFSQNDTVNIRISDNEIEKVKEPIDTTTIKAGNKIFIFIEYEESMVIDRINIKTGEKKRLLNLECNDSKLKKDTNKFRGHWSGIEVGINEFVNSGFSIKRPMGYSYLNLNTFRSWNVNINFAQYSLPIIKNRVGLVTGFGLEMNSYFYQGDNNIQINESIGVIEERELENEYNVRKSKFTTTYLTMPVILEAQLGKGNRKESFYISGGVIGGYNIASAIKVKHEVEGKKQKLIERRGDLNINPFRVGLTVRIGHKDKDNNSMGLYATYYLTPFFEKDMGPELHPFAIGLRIDM